MSKPLQVANEQAIAARLSTHPAQKYSQDAFKGRQGRLQGDNHTAVIESAPGPSSISHPCANPKIGSMVLVLVCSGCYSKIPQTRWLINNRYLFFTVLEAGKSKNKAPEDSVSQIVIFSLCTHMAEGTRKLLQVSSRRVPILLARAPPS